ncbi:MULTISPECIES: pentapeptide repeat-containing protein [unclassified Coleofasciculus]|uniref:pentapeptide repeat-containing protein n=1 Tax=unclassified Coleofasciculus TaxID=2692782 RepID=UPI001882F1D2|nr:MULTISPECIES: pentapeptide repeat-containing protein [unclassified Coleofasciculus]MBE9129389.1 pentapeptide repeat-containing protein [Coleofasciculus sp. LEGE 07081]MBE9152023.1 pentapeptide repeat-containing protein [Coleofasciculus sp. LEGE 07092]
MNRSDFRIPEDKTQDVFTLAAELYAQHNQSYSVKELMEAGAEAKIPPEFVQQAIEQLQLQQVSAQPSLYKTKRSKPLLLGLAIGLPALIALGFAGWLLPRNAATNAAINEPVETVEPITNPIQVSEVNVGGESFKCNNLNFEGKDLRNENFRNADCTRANLAGVNLSGVDISSANLSGADLKGADLSGANLRNANLTEAQLEGANLKDANLQDANLSKTDLNDADLRGAELKQTNFADAELEGAEVDVVGAKKEGANFSNATLPDGTVYR